MTGVSLSTALLASMKTHACETYPEECCGFLIGEVPGAVGDGPRSVAAVERGTNRFPGSRRHRFRIAPEELRDADLRAARSGRTVIGFYHSHPDQRARPSRSDRDHAWPGCPWILLTVTSTDVPDVRAFELDPDSRVFREARLRVDAVSPVRPAMAEGWARA